MDVNHNLPLDILRLLFEFSASTNLKSAQALSLVAKEVQLWIDPYLFQIVRVVDDDDLGISKTSLLDQMCKSDASPRFILARNYVRGIAWREFVSQESYVKQALENFPNLTQLCLWGNIFPFQPQEIGGQKFEINNAYTSLRRVSTCVYDHLNLPQNAFGSPFWMTVTHLQIRHIGGLSTGYSPVQFPLFTAMTSLTHLALTPMTSEGELNVHVALSRVKKTFPPSLILCLLAVRAPLADQRDWLLDLSDACLKVDERIVLWSMSHMGDVDGVVTNGGHTFQTWCGVQDKMHTFWDMGEAVLFRRQERLRAV
ncbi:hypothetical protein DL96DRAFT_1814202 [Flagelloscypha sp. PMI_526]|nr:hypothetical protein DL96DRAFT_1814202 [Flagelloscypha sp. PMI_526]